MSHAAALPEAFVQMTVDEQVLFVQRLWDVIAERTDGVQVPAGVLIEAERRLETHRTDPASSISEEALFDRMGLSR